MSEKRIIEISGNKLEVDLTSAKSITTYKVGDSVKVLIKNYSDYKSYVGQIIAFDDFKEHPTVVIAYLDISHSSAKIEFCYFNSETEGVELTALNDFDLPLTKSELLGMFDRDIVVKSEELKEVKRKKDVFEKLFGKYFDK